MNGNYSKKANRFPKEIVSIENIQRAIEQEKQFKNEIGELLDNLGSKDNTYLTVFIVETEEKR